MNARCAISCVLLLGLVVAPARVTSSASIEQRYVANLRERGVYRLAERYCRQRLASGLLDDREQVETAIEWSLVSVAKAYDASPADRDIHWQAASQVLDNWTKVPNRPFALLAQLQVGLNLQAEAELAALELLGTADSVAVQNVQSQVRKSIGILKDVSDEVAIRRQQLAMRRTTGEPELNKVELSALDRNIKLALAKAFRTQSRTYGKETDDRVNALQQAAEALAKLSSSEPTDDLCWQARVAWLDAMAELELTQQAMAAIDRWRTEGEVPPEAQAGLVAAGAKLLASIGKPQQAAAQLDASFPAGRSAEVDLVRLQLLLAEAQPNDQSIESLLATFRGRHAPRYVRQAEAMVGSRFAAAGDAASAMARVHAAEHFYRAGRLADAVSAYDQAAEVYRGERNRERAFACERSAAAIVAQQRDFASAAARYRRLALGSVDRDDSAGDHREALLCLATIARQSAAESSAQAMSDYLTACREHLRHWPMAATAAEVRVWLARSLAARKQWQAVLDVLEPFELTSPFADQAFPLLATSYRERMAELDGKSARVELSRKAVDKLKPMIVGTGEIPEWPVEWSQAQRLCALELARITLDTGSYSFAETLLNAAIKFPPKPEPHFIDQATPILAMAYVLGGKTREAIDLLRNSTEGNVGSGSLEQLARRLTDNIATYAQSSSPRPTEQAALGQLLLEVVKAAGASTDQWKMPADRYRAVGYAAIMNAEEASMLYEKLLNEFPKNGTLREEYARLLATSTTTSAREKALALWSQLERGSKRGGERWQRARQARIDLLLALGRRQEAEKLEMLTKLLSRGN